MSQRQALAWCARLLGACHKQADTGTPNALKVALITPGSVADAAWNAGAYQGLQQIRDSLGAAISNIEAHTPVERVARDFPNTILVITSGQRLSGNVIPLVFRIHKATYLAGMLAGAMTHSGKIGFIGGMELPPIRLGDVGWVQGATAVRPKVETRITYLNTFDDAAAGKEAALAMIRAGVDQLHHNADAVALGVFAAARESPGVYVCGANGNRSSLAPDRVIASAVVDLPRALLLVSREILRGGFIPHAESFGLGSGVIRLAVNRSLERLWPADLKERTKAAGDSIVAGTLKVAGQ